MVSLSYFAALSYFAVTLLKYTFTSHLLHFTEATVSFVSAH